MDGWKKARKRMKELRGGGKGTEQHNKVQHRGRRVKRRSGRETRVESGRSTLDQ